MTNIDLYTCATPNGRQASATLEELELRYNPKPADIAAGERKAPEYVAIDPRCVRVSARPATQA